VTSVDFIIELPDSHGFDAAMVVVDSVTKCGHFVPTHTTVTALGSARLYLQHVWKLHGLPRFMVSDRGPQFVAEFMRKLYRLLGIKVSASTAYHPQSDGQTEHVNQEFEQYIRVFVNERQDDWDTLLPLPNSRTTTTLTPRRSTLPSSSTLVNTPAWVSNLTNLLRRSKQSMNLPTI
jgi:transposase InsO family protein